MNDEIVHTGFQKMACYLFAVCSGKNYNFANINSSTTRISILVLRNVLTALS